MAKIYKCSKYEIYGNKQTDAKLKHPHSYASVWALVVWCLSVFRCGALRSLDGFPRAGHMSMACRRKFVHRLGALMVEVSQQKTRGSPHLTQKDRRRIEASLSVSVGLPCACVVMLGGSQGWPGGIDGTYQIISK